MPRMEQLDGIASSAEITMDELQLAARNHGMPLEGLRYDVTPAGMHYLLIHFDVPQVDESTWRLRVGGLVGTPLELSIDDLRRRPRITNRVTMECAGNGRARLLPRPLSQPWLNEAVGTAEWTGTPLAPILREAGVAADAADIVFTGADHGTQGGVEQDYQRSLSIDEAMGEHVLLAFEMNGQPLLPQHGFPLRLVVPGWYGMTSVKWLTGISVAADSFAGYQMDAYRLRQHPDDAGEPVTRMKPRALMIPPGFPDFSSRVRSLAAGTHVVRGRAWSGWGAIDRVEFSADGGTAWRDTELVPGSSPDAWCAWSTTWEAGSGEHELIARATDTAGNTQPLDPPWNYHGLGNNTPQRVSVYVTDSDD
jgi:DMSO/TMAO reductase YedYZ molybdopterin-dependent catalytic subunit